MEIYGGCMLTRFTVGNFRSFDKVQSLSMIAGSIQKHKERLFKAPDFKVLKFGALYGANASGKSNFVDAMQFALMILRFGTKTCDKESYFRLNIGNKKKNSYFEFEFVVDGKNFAYGFEILISEGSIIEEWLIELKPQKNKILFSRNTETLKYYFNKDLIEKKSYERLSIYFDDYKSVRDKLFLGNIVAEKNDFIKNNLGLEILNHVYHWLFNINVSSPETPVTGYDCLTNKDSAKLLQSLKCFATGISNIKFNNVSKEQVLKDLPQKDRSRIEEQLTRFSACPHCRKKHAKSTLKINGNLFFATSNSKGLEFQEILFEHNDVKDVLFSLGDESDGTQRLLDLLSVVLCKEKNTLFVIDEIDRCLHPQLTVYFVKKFLNFAKKKNIQLLISTHESHLLDLDILRQDEIFLVEKRNDGSSEIYPFDRFKERFDKKIEKPYLEGRYGGSPIFDDFFSFDEEV